MFFHGIKSRTCKWPTNQEPRHAPDMAPGNYHKRSCPDGADGGESGMMFTALTFIEQLQAFIKDLESKVASQGDSINYLQAKEASQEDTIKMLNEQKLATEERHNKDLANRDAAANTLVHSNLRRILNTIEKRDKERDIRAMEKTKEEIKKEVFDEADFMMNEKADTLKAENKRIFRSQIEMEEIVNKRKRRDFALYHKELKLYEERVTTLARNLSEGVWYIRSSSVKGQLLQVASSELGLKILNDCASAKANASKANASKANASKANASKANASNTPNNKNTTNWTTRGGLLEKEDVNQAVKSSSILQFAVNIITKHEKEITRLNNEIKTSAPSTTAKLQATEKKLVDLACDLEELLDTNRHLHTLIIDTRSENVDKPPTCSKCQKLQEPMYEPYLGKYARETVRWFKGLPTEDKLDGLFDTEIAARETVFGQITDFEMEV